MAERKPQLIWSPEAEADLSEIWNYCAQAADPGTADNLVRGIGEACRMLADHPLSGRSRDEVRPDLRSTVVSPFVIFYRVKDHVPQLVRIIDGRRDIDEIFADVADQT